MIDQGDKAEAAWRFRALGLVLLPVHFPVDGHCSCRAACGCASPAKHPASSWKGIAEQSETELYAMLRDYPRHNLGVRLAGSDLVVLDVDPSRAGERALAGFERRRGEPLPATLRVATASGGWHLYYPWPTGFHLDAELLRFLPGVTARSSAGMW